MPYLQLFVPSWMRGAARHGAIVGGRGGVAEEKGVYQIMCRSPGLHSAVAKCDPVGVRVPHISGRRLGQLNHQLFFLFNPMPYAHPFNYKRTPM